MNMERTILRKYVDVRIIVYNQPRPAFHRYLQAIVDAGFTSRVMFGSDQMVWPEAIERAIDVIDEAPFLSALTPHTSSSSSAQTGLIRGPLLRRRSV